MRDFQIFADFPGGEFNDFAMARHRRNFSGRAIDVDSMIASFTQEFATMTLKMAD